MENHTHLNGKVLISSILRYFAKRPILAKVKRDERRITGNVGGNLLGKEILL